MGAAIAAQQASVANREMERDIARHYSDWRRRLMGIHASRAGTKTTRLRWMRGMGVSPCAAGFSPQATARPAWNAL